MAKQQTLTVVVADDMADPADLVERALERYLDFGPIRPEWFSEDPGDTVADELEDRSPSGYIILEED